MKKVAIPITSDNQLEDHFGHGRFYEIYTLSDSNEVIDVKLLESEPGCGCKSNIIEVLASQGVTTILAGSMGAGAYNKLTDAGITAIRGCSGASSEIFIEYSEGQIKDGGLTCSNHDEGHVCEQ